MVACNFAFNWAYNFLQANIEAQEDDLKYHEDRNLALQVKPRLDATGRVPS